MWGLIIGACLGVIAIGLRVDDKLNEKWFIVMLFVALGAGLAIAYFGSTKKLKAGVDGIELEIFQKEVNSVKQDAIDELKKEVVIQKEAVLSLIDKANDTRKELLRVAEMASPPHLSLESKKITQVEGEYEVKLEFKPSKNIPFGYISFSAKIHPTSNATITLLNPYETEVWGNPGNISDDGKEATLWYVPRGLWQRIALRVSSPCKISISSNHMRDDLELTVE